MEGGPDAHGRPQWPRGDHHDPVAVTVQGCTLSDQLDHVGTIELGRSPVSTLVPSLTTMVLFSMGAKRLKYKESLYTHGPVALQGN